MWMTQIASHTFLHFNNIQEDLLALYWQSESLALFLSRIQCSIFRKAFFSLPISFTSLKHNLTSLPFLVAPLPQHHLCAYSSHAHVKPPITQPVAFYLLSLSLSPCLALMHQHLHRHTLGYSWSYTELERLTAQTLLVIMHVDKYYMYYYVLCSISLTCLVCKQLMLKPCSLCYCIACAHFNSLYINLLFWKLLQLLQFPSFIRNVCLSIRLSKILQS